MTRTLTQVLMDWITQGDPVMVGIILLFAVSTAFWFIQFLKKVTHIKGKIGKVELDIDTKAEDKKLIPAHSGYKDCPKVSDIHLLIDKEAHLIENAERIKRRVRDDQMRYTEKMIAFFQMQVTDHFEAEIEKLDLNSVEPQNIIHDHIISNQKDWIIIGYKMVGILKDHIFEDSFGYISDSSEVMSLKDHILTTIEDVIAIHFRRMYTAKAILSLERYEKTIAEKKIDLQTMITDVVLKAIDIRQKSEKEVAKLYEEFDRYVYDRFGEI